MHGHVGILIVHGYEKNSIVVYGHVKNFDCGEIFGGALIFLAWKLFWHVICHGIMTLTFMLQSLKSRGSLQMLKNMWEALSPNIKNIINDVDFGTFFEALLNQKTYEYKDLRLLLALAERFWDTTCTFHFPGIGEVMLTPDDFSVITNLMLGGERIRVNDSLTSTEIKKLLGVVLSRMKSKNVPLSWLCENISQCDTVAKGTCMFMLLFIGTFLHPNLGSIVNPRYLWSLRKIEQIRNYDWGSMAYATLLHFMT